MNSVKDFTPGQRVTTDLGDGTVSKIGRVYVYVDIDGGKTEKLTPADLRELALVEEIPAAADEPVTTVPATIYLDPKYSLTHNTASIAGRPPMRIKGNRASADTRRAARKAQRRSRRANRTR